MSSSGARKQQRLLWELLSESREDWSAEIVENATVADLDSIPGTVEEMIQSDSPPEVYRNPCLAQAMVNLNMIDTIGSGIKRTFRRQEERNFPMPDYALRDP